MKIRGVLGMIDTRSRGGLTLGSECADVRGYRPVPLWAYGGRLRGQIDRFWPDGLTIRFEGTLPENVTLMQLISQGYIGPSMALTGESASHHVGERFLPDWELHRVELVSIGHDGFAELPWPECRVEIDHWPSRPTHRPYVVE